NSTFECKLDSGLYETCSSPKTYSNLSDATHTFNVRAKDSSGNTDQTPSMRTWNIDSTPPQTSITSSPNSSTTSTSASFSFNSSESPSTFECRLDNGSYSSCSSPKAYSNLSVGQHTFDVRAKDSANNTDQSVASF